MITNRAGPLLLALQTNSSENQCVALVLEGKMKEQARGVYHTARGYLHLTQLWYRTLLMPSKHNQTKALSSLHCMLLHTCKLLTCMYMCHTLHAAMEHFHCNTHYHPTYIL